MTRIQGLYRLSNFRGESRPMTEVFQGGIPTGAGDCCAPKLLNHAALHGLTPLGISEFYWGRENRSGRRKHGEFHPVTGRTHQLRLHAASTRGLGIPILGDRLYGVGTGQGRLRHHARFLSFTHPRSSERLEFHSDPPFWSFRSVPSCPVQSGRRPWMIRMRITTTAATMRRWMKPPIVYAVTSPSAQRTMSTTAIVNNIEELLSRTPAAFRDDPAPTRWARSPACQPVANGPAA
jgi:hypothetical protein